MCSVTELGIRRDHCTKRNEKEVKISSYLSSSMARVVSGFQRRPVGVGVWDGATSWRNKVRRSVGSILDGGAVTDFLWHFWG